MPAAFPERSRAIIDADQVANRRRNWREPVLASGILIARSASGATAQRQVRVVNLSAGGVGMTAQAAVAEGFEYHLSILGRSDRSGLVRIAFCRPHAQGFEIGAQFVRAGVSHEPKD